MDLRYPIGTFDFQQTVAPEARPELIGHIAATPSCLREALRGLTESQLDTPYRPEGWTPRQVAHHLADGHMHVYIRFRLALTLPDPEVKAFDEATWAKFPDARSGPLEPSLQILDGLHHRWVLLLRSMNDEDFARRYVHSDLGPLRLDTALALYSWHGRHHVGHITSLRRRNGW
jgi:hypothetical protein